MMLDKSLEITATRNNIAQNPVQSYAEEKLFQSIGLCSDTVLFGIYTREGMLASTAPLF